MKTLSLLRFMTVNANVSFSQPIKPTLINYSWLAVAVQRALLDFCLAYVLKIRRGIRGTWNKHRQPNGRAPFATKVRRLRNCYSNVTRNKSLIKAFDVTIIQQLEPLPLS
jgi:hypothetical protein